MNILFWFCQLANNEKDDVTMKTLDDEDSTYENEDEENDNSNEGNGEIESNEKVRLSLSPTFFL